MSESRDYKLVVHPDCCDLMRFHRAVYLVMPHSWSDGDIDTPPTWCVNAFNYLNPDDPKSCIWDGYCEAKACPFCAQPLPQIHKIERKKKICTCSDGGYYCDTCSKRLMECRCLPPMFRWAPVKEKK